MSENKRGSTALAMKAGLWYVVSTFLLRSIAFITTPIFTRLMSTGTYGEFSNYANWQVILMVIVGFELYNTLPRAYYDFKDNYDEYVSTVTIAECLLAGICYSVFIAFKDTLLSVVSIPEQFIHIMFITIMCSSLKTVFMTRERTLYRYKTVAMISAVDVIISTLISVALVYFSDESLRLGARIYGQYVPSAVIGFICAIVLIKKGKCFKIEHIKYAIVLAFPLMIHYLTGSLLTTTNVIIAKSISGAEVAAMISIGVSVTHIVTMLFQAVSGAVTTWIMDNLAQGNSEKLKKEIAIYIIGLASVSVGVILLAPEVIMILGGSKYADAIMIIQGLILGTFIQSVTTVFTIILTYDKNVGKVAIYTGIVSVISVVAKIVLLPILGIQSLPYTNVVAFVVLFVICYILVAKAGYKDVVDLKVYIAIIGAVVLLTIGSYFLYGNIIMRYAVILAILVASLFVVYKNIKLITKIILKK